MKVNPIQDLLESYNNIFASAKKKGYKNIVSVSLGTGVHCYKHNDIANIVVNKLNVLVNKYGINFMLILPNQEIKEIYVYK